VRAIGSRRTTEANAAQTDGAARAAPAVRAGRSAATRGFNPARSFGLDRRLAGSPIYASQRQLAARVAPPDDKMRLLLTSLSERGGKLSRAALAHRLSLPEVRIGGLLSAVRRLLNVDQASVLTVDETAGTVELNVALLHQQFRLPGQGGQR
jgi:hypothetical protein